MYQGMNGLISRPGVMDERWVGKGRKWPRWDEVHWGQRNWWEGEIERRTSFVRREW